jgi:hypothetical protein
MIAAGKPQSSHIASEFRTKSRVAQVSFTAITELFQASITRALCCL